MKITIIYLLAFSFFLSGHNLKAQDEGFIYGKITTIDGNEYTGALRWGKEEVYWHDIFNATKTSNKYLEQLSPAEKRDVTKKDWGVLDWKIMSIWSDEYSNVLHQFGCRFGDISAIEITGRNQLILTLKDGSTMDLRGGSNDVGTYIRIHDFEIGELKLKWDRIERIDFMNTPSKLEDSFGDPLYGEVETVQDGKFRGFVQWDHDERVGKDVLDGNSGDGSVSIRFSNIKQIRKEGNRSRVELKSGRNMLIGGTNDVNSGNRGIIVSINGIGRVDIPWQQFRQVTFENINNSGKSYKSYPSPSKLKGTVVMIDDEKISGIIVYDIDEALDIELIQGKDDDIEYIIPIRNIKKIRPRNYNYSTVEFRKKGKVLIGDARDVSDKNSGLLVFEKGKKSPTYIPWRKVSEIIFD